MSKLHILIADDHAIVREGLKRLIEAQPDMEVQGEAAEGREAIKKAIQLRPDIAVLDISMGEFGGIHVTKQLKSSCPSVRVLVLTVHEDNTYVQALLQAGAAGYILKRAASDELITAIRSIAEGGTYLDPRVAGRLVNILIQPANAPSATAQLSERESEIIRLIALGYTNKEAASELRISVKTVETYRARSMEKLGLRSRIDVVRVAAERGWLEAPAR